MVCVNCGICDVSFKSESSYNQHKKFLHDGEQFQCNYCGKQLRHKTSLATHIIGVHKKIKHNCDQ